MEYCITQVLEILESRNLFFNYFREIIVHWI